MVNENLLGTDLLFFNKLSLFFSTGLYNIEMKESFDKYCAKVIQIQVTVSFSQIFKFEQIQNSLQFFK